MPVLESKLIIGAKDETGPAFAAIKAHIAAIDKQIATFDKLSTAAKGIAKANDPMIAAIDRGAKALRDEKSALESLSRSMLDGVSSAEGMASAQAKLAAEVSKANRVMVTQGETAGRVAGKIAKAQESARSGGMLGGMMPLAGPAILGGTKKALEEGASLEQMKFRVRGVSGGDKTESPFAEQLAADVAAKYPAITQAKALDTYLELRGNAANQNGTINQEIARRNLMTVAQAQTASLSLGSELTPEDAQNLLKAVEGSGRAGDPTAVGKMFDSYIRAKQVFGSAIDSSKIRDYVQNAKGANFGVGEEQFFWQNIVRMTEGNASRLGNETAQTLQTLVGGHSTKQTAKWLVGMGLATGFTPQGGGNATVHGLSGSGTLQVNQLDWANQYLLPALKAHGVLSEENIAKREALLKKDNPNIDARALRERAEQGLISSAIAQSGMRTTVTDNLAHAIANELLINRDVAQMKGASGSADLAGRIGQNPAAAMAELTGSLANFAATLTDPIMPQAAKALSNLANAIADATKQMAEFSKAHPTAAAAASAGVVAGVAGYGLAQVWKLFSGLGRLFGGAPAAASGGGAAAAGGGGLGRLLGGVVAGASMPGFIDLLTDDNRTPTAKANDAAIMARLKSWAFGSPAAAAPMQLPGATPATPLGTMPYFPTHGRDVHSPQTGPYSYYPPKGAESISVSGQAQVEHTVHVDVSLEDGLKAKIDQVISTLGFTVPLIGGGAGRMDSDAGPHRVGGVGHM